MDPKEKFLHLFLPHVSQPISHKFIIFSWQKDDGIFIARVENRKMKNPPIKKEDIARWLEIFQAPTSDEMALFDHAEEISS